MKKILIYFLSAIMVFGFLCVNVEAKNENKKIIVIDPGHQKKGDNKKEPVGPGSKKMKSRCTTGTTGKYSGILESEFTLDVSLKLKEELERRGYTVILTRDKQDVNLSNAERAIIANKAKADAFIRIHANGSENSKIKGAMTLCQTKNNPYNGKFYAKSRKLSECVLNKLSENTKCKKRCIQETDTMSGINWASVPVTIVEAGYMSNKEEDLLMATDEYRQKIDEYFK